MKGEIKIEGARENNLKNIDVSIPWHKYTVITGLSGSGKSSLALDTLYAEGLRRYMECLSTYARQFLERVDRPDMDDISGLPPAVAIESRNNVRNSRSTVGTSTEIFDYLRLLYAKIGKIYCPNCDIEIKRRSPEDIADELINHYTDERAMLSYPLPDSVNSPDQLLKRGYTRILFNGELLDIEELESLPEDYHVLLDRFILNKKSYSRIVDSLETAFSENKSININIVDGGTLSYSKELECPYCKTKFGEPTPLLFSFNSPQGACTACKGFGNILQLDPDLVVPNADLSLEDGAVEPFTKPSLGRDMNRLLEFAKTNSIDTGTPYTKLSKKQKDLIFKGGSGFSGVSGVFKYLEGKSYKMHVRVFLSKYRSAFNCDECAGARLTKEALWVRVGQKTIAELADMSIDGLREFVDALVLSDYETKVVEELLKQIHARIDFLIKVGLDYLSLSRLSRTLSGGEAQRVNLACQLGSTLTDTLYILDEPSIGLHPRDIDRLILLIKELRDRGNTVVLVEHDFDMIRAADHIIELGPYSGVRGGEIIYQGGAKQLLSADSISLTKAYLNGTAHIPVPKKRRRGSGKKLIVRGAQENNLKNVNASFPLGTFICVTGVSGSGKSSLVTDVLYSALARKLRGEAQTVGEYKDIKGVEYISDVLMLDQNPIGKSLRSNPVTYIKAYDEIRKALAGTWGARSKSFAPSHFSFNVAGGRCDTCEGEGRQKVEMQFLADVYLTCEDCDGKRFKKEVLAVTYNGKNIVEVLDMTVNQAINFFYDIPALGRKLKILQDVGLGYITLGQPAPTLSGGEAQRIKIARELGKKGGKDILYILDEPTVGLHAEDVKKLLEVIGKLVTAGNTVLVVEHNLDVIKSADYIIDLGPEGGEAGGEILVEGTPEQVALSPDSYTGKYLSKELPS